MPRRILRLARKRHGSLGHESPNVHNLVHVFLPEFEELRLGSADEELRGFAHGLLVHDVALEGDEGAARGGGEEESDGSGGGGAGVVGLVGSLLPLGEGTEHLPLRHLFQHLGDELAMVLRLLHHGAPALKRGHHVLLGEPDDSLLELLAHVLGLLHHGQPAVKGTSDRPVTKPAERLRHLLLHLERLLGVIFPSLERDGSLAQDDLAEDLVAQVLDSLDLLHLVVPPHQRRAFLSVHKADDGVLQHRHVVFVLGHQRGPVREGRGQCLVLEPQNRLGELCLCLEHLQHVLVPAEERGSKRGVLEVANRLPDHLTLLVELHDSHLPRLQRADESAVDEIGHRVANRLLLLAKLEPAVPGHPQRAVDKRGHRLGHHLLVLLLVDHVLLPTLESLEHLAVEEELHRVTHDPRLLHALPPPGPRGALLLVHPPRHRALDDLSHFLLVLHEVLPPLPRGAELLVHEPLDKPGNLEPLFDELLGVIAPGVERRGALAINEVVRRLLEHLAVLVHLVNHLPPALPADEHRLLGEEHECVLDLSLGLRGKDHKLLPPREGGGELAVKKPAESLSGDLHLVFGLLHRIRPGGKRSGHGAVLHLSRDSHEHVALVQDLVDVLPPRAQRSDETGLEHGLYGVPELLPVVVRASPLLPSHPHVAAPRKVGDPVEALLLAQADDGEVGPRVESRGFCAVGEPRGHLVEEFLHVDRLRGELLPSHESSVRSHGHESVRNLHANLCESPLLLGVLVPRAHAPNRGAVDHHRHHLANLLAVGSRLLNLGGPLVERGGELLVGKFSRDAAQLLPGIQDLLDVRAPALEGARERAIAELGGGAREQLPAVNPLVIRRAPLDVSHRPDAVAPHLLGVSAESLQRRQDGLPLGEVVRLGVTPPHGHGAGKLELLLLGHRGGDPPGVKVLLRQLRPVSLARGVHANLEPRRELAPVQEPAAQGLAVPEPQRVKLHDVLATPPPRQAPAKRLRLPERHGYHPVLHRRLPRDSQRPERGRVPHPHPERGGHQLEIRVPALRRILVHQTRLRAAVLRRLPVVRPRMARRARIRRRRVPKARTAVLRPRRRRRYVRRPVWCDVGVLRLVLLHDPSPGLGEIAGKRGGRRGPTPPRRVNPRVNPKT